MIVADTKINTEGKVLLASLIGKTFEKYRCDAPRLEGKVFSIGYIGIVIDGSEYAFSNERAMHNLFGDEDEIPEIHFIKAKLHQTNPFLATGKNLIDTLVDKVILDIRVYEDTQIMQIDGQDAYEYSYTPAVVFQFEKSQLVVEGDGWIMETMHIHKGLKAEEKIQAAIDDIEEEDRDHIRVKRTITSLKDYKKD